MQNIAKALRNPALGMEYIGWRLRSLAGPVTFSLRNGARIGNFVNFSEYHSMRVCISAAEQNFFLTRTPKDDSPIIDIGANIGIVSALLGREFPERTIHAFEPGPTTFEALGKNLALNGLERVVAHRVALADKPGTLVFDAPPKRRANAKIATAASLHPVKVEATTLDAFIAEQGITAIGLLKIDVEGYETAVFRGAARMLEKRLPGVIFMEVCPPLARLAGFDPAEPARLVEDAGYAWHRLEETGALTPVSSADTAPIVLENWVALQR